MLVFTSSLFFPLKENNAVTDFGASDFDIVPHDRDRLRVKKKKEKKRYADGSASCQGGLVPSRFPLHEFINILVPSHPETVYDNSFIRRLAIYSLIDLPPYRASIDVLVYDVKAQLAKREFSHSFDIFFVSFNSFIGTRTATRAQVSIVDEFQSSVSHASHVTTKNSLNLVNFKQSWHYIYTNFHDLEEISSRRFPNLIKLSRSIVI